MSAQHFTRDMSLLVVRTQCGHCADIYLQGYMSALYSSLGFTAVLQQLSFSSSHMQKKTASHVNHPSMRLKIVTFEKHLHMRLKSSRICKNDRIYATKISHTCENGRICNKKKPIPYVKHWHAQFISKFVMQAFYSPTCICVYGVFLHICDIKQARILFDFVSYADFLHMRAVFGRIMQTFRKCVETQIYISKNRIKFF